MVTRAREQIGVMDCVSCGKEVPVKKMTDTGTLSAPCTWCDYSLYAKVGTPAYGNIMAKVRLNAPPPEPAMAEASPAPKKPAPAAAAADRQKAKMPWER